MRAIILLFATLFFTLPLMALTITEGKSGISGTVLGVVIVVLTILLTDLLKAKIPMKSLSIQVLSWIVGTALALICYFMSFGIFQNISFIDTLSFGFGFGLISNGVSDTGVITFIRRKVAGIFKQT